MLPEGWHRTTLGAVAKFHSGNTPSKERTSFWGGDFPWVTARDMKTLRLHATKLGLSHAGVHEAAVAPSQAVLVLTRGMTLLKDLPVCLIEREMAFNQDIKALVPLPEVYAPFLAYQLLARKGAILNLVDTAGHGTGRLDTGLLKESEFWVPPLGEQRRIASILSTWDQAIATAERLVAASQTEKDVLANVLLSGRRRLIHHQQWAPRPLSAMVYESRVLGSGGNTAKKLTVKLYGRGVVGKAEKRVGSESTQYYRRSAGQFIYSKLDFLNGAFGLVPATLDGYESTLDLPAFDFLPGTEPRWFLHFVSRQEFYLGHLGLANGGRKARRVSPSDLLRVSIDTPSFAEQRAIAEAIDLAQTRVICFEHQVRLLRDEKAALMAQLLTGKRRVRLDQEGTVSP